MAGGRLWVESAPGFRHCTCLNPQHLDLRQVYSNPTPQMGVLRPERMGAAPTHSLGAQRQDLNLTVFPDYSIRVTPPTALGAPVQPLHTHVGSPLCCLSPALTGRHCRQGKRSPAGICWRSRQACRHSVPATAGFSGRKAATQHTGKSRALWKLGCREEGSVLT